MNNDSFSLRISSILGVVFSVLIFILSFIPIVGAKIFPVEVLLILILIGFIALGIKFKKPVGLLSFAAVLAILAIIVSFLQKSSINFISETGKELNSRLDKSLAPKSTPPVINHNIQLPNLNLESAIECNTMAFARSRCIHGKYQNQYHKRSGGIDQICYLAPIAYFIDGNQSLEDPDGLSNIIVDQKKEIQLFKRTKFLWDGYYLSSQENYQFPGYYYETGNGTKTFSLILNASDKQMQYINEIKQQEKQFESMNEFEKRNNSAIEEHILELKRQLALDVANEVAQISKQGTTVYFTNLQINLKDTDYSFNDQSLRIKLTSEFLNIDNRSVFFWDKKKGVFNGKVRLSFSYADFVLSDATLEGYYLVLPISENIVSALFDGKSTVPVILRFYYTLDFDGKIGEFRINNYSEYQDTYDWVIYPTLKIFAGKFYGQDRVNALKEF